MAADSECCHFVLKKSEVPEMNQLSVTARPRWKEDTVADVLFSYEAEIEKFPEEEAAMLFPLQGFGGLCPFSEYENLNFRDQEGELDYEIRTLPGGENGIVYQGIFLSGI